MASIASVVIKTGFQTINYNFSKDSTSSKKKKLLESHHVFDVEECDGEIRGKVIQQTSVNAVPYNVVIKKIQEVDEGTKTNLNSDMITPMPSEIPLHSGLPNILDEMQKRATSKEIERQKRLESEWSKEPEQFFDSQEDPKVAHERIEKMVDSLIGLNQLSDDEKSGEADEKGG